MLAGSGGDFVELFNASDTAFDLSGFGVTNTDDAGIRYATSLRFGNGTEVSHCRLRASGGACSAAPKCT